MLLTTTQKKTSIVVDVDVLWVERMQMRENELSGHIRLLEFDRKWRATQPTTNINLNVNNIVLNNHLNINNNKIMNFVTS